MQNSIEQLHNFQSTYSKIDLTFVDEDYDKIGYYLKKFNNFKYHTFCTLQKHIDNVYDENIKNLTAIIGYPFSTTLEINASTLQKCDTIEIWIDYNRVLRGPDKVFKSLRKATLKAHANGVKVRAVTELKKLPNHIINEWIDVCKRCSVDSIQTGYGLTSINHNWIPELKEKLHNIFTIKVVGNVNSIETAEKLIQLGADYIGSSTI